MIQKAVADDELLRRVHAGLAEVGASPALIAKRRLPLFSDATELTVAHVSASGREHRLAPTAAKRWQEMRASAEKDGVALLRISGFRSFEQQLELIKAKLARGDQIGV